MKKIIALLGVIIVLGVVGFGVHSVSHSQKKESNTIVIGSQGSDF